MTEKQRIFIIGDIHGCHGALQRLMDKINWDPDRDGLIFIGDYIDRGEDSKGVIDFIIRLKGMSPHVQCLMGNHEDLFLKYLEGGDLGIYLFNGGGATLRSYGIYDGADVSPEHLEFLKSLRLFIELEDFLLVHAGLQPGIEIRKQSTHDLLWIREPFIHSDYDFGKRVVFGHTPFPEPFVMDNKIGLDTGAVYGNRLTCLELPVMEFHSVRA